MCGILARLSRGRPVEPEALARGLSALRRRGPDGEGVWIEPGGRVALAHARLALVDPAGGAQPLASEDSSVRAVVNGEFYGEGALRSELESRGHRFATRSDSELAVHLYEEHGLDFARRLRGEFALVLWDGRKRRLIAVRDRFGVKPLLYARVDEALVLASNARALFELGLPRAWDQEAVLRAFSLQYPPPDRSLFSGARMLPPGHLLLAEEGQARLQRYWDLNLAREGEACPADREEAAKELRRLLSEAVRLRLRGDVPVACQLSGGIASASVLALAAEAGRPPACFSVGFESEEHDELPLARESAALSGAPLIEVRLSERELADALPEAAACAEGLAVNAHLAAKFLLSRAVRVAGFKVALTGEGADEVLLGYPHFAKDLALAPVRAGVAAGVLSPEGPGLSLSGAEAVLGTAPAFLAAKASLGLRLRGLLREDFLAPRAERDVPAELCAEVPPAQFKGRSPVRTAQYLWCATALPGSILRTLGDGTEAAHGIEGRLPFLDHVFFDFAKRLPPDWLWDRGVEKALLREAMGEDLAPQVRTRRKHPFYAPPMGPTLRELARDAFSGAGLPPFLDGRKAAGLLDGPRTPGAEAAAMTALTAVLLHRGLGLGGA